MLGTFSGKLARLPGLAAMLGEPVVHMRRARDLKRKDVHAGLRAIIGWGQRPSTHAPRALAAKHGLPFIALEDGFLRSWGTGATHPGLSLVVDEEGIYYDATRPSALESLLASDADVLSGTDYARARDLILQARLSKYNHAPLNGDVLREDVLREDVLRTELPQLHRGQLQRGQSGLWPILTWPNGSHPNLKRFL